MRTHRFLAVLATLALALTIPVSASATTTARVPSGRTAIGDSVMLGAKSHLQDRGFFVNASVSRQVDEGISTLRAMKHNGNLRKQVVVHLGTNGTFSTSQCDSIRRIVGKHRNLFLVTIKVPRSWAAGNNRVIESCSERHKHTYVIDWKKFVSSHSGLLEGDGYHLTPKGAKKYAVLVDHKVDQHASR